MEATSAEQVGSSLLMVSQDPFFKHLPLFVFASRAPPRVSIPHAAVRTVPRPQIRRVQGSYRAQGAPVWLRHCGQDLRRDGAEYSHRPQSREVLVHAVIYTRPQGSILETPPQIR